MPGTVFFDLDGTLTDPKAGIVLYVATSKPRIFADRILNHFHLDKYFSEILGSELDGTRSDKGDLLRFARWFR